MTQPPCLVIAVGNPSRGDDALAPMLLQRLREWVADNGREDEIELLEDFQLQVEHATDMVARERVLFMDAGMQTPAPYMLERIQPHGGNTLFSHALPPEQVLTTYVHVYGEAPPPSFLLCISGSAFELGTALSEHGAHNLEAAYACAVELLQAENVSAWERLRSGHA